jgi:uncharacterized protein (DUF433 family)
MDGTSDVSFWISYAPWQLDQLSKLRQSDAERVESMLNTLWQSYPGLVEELAAMAVVKGDLATEAAATLVGMTVPQMEAMVVAVRNRQASAETDLIHVQGKVAKISDRGVAVWEIVREYRKLGSVERLADSFPTLTRAEIAAALRYAQSNSADIELQIARYEEALSNRRRSYPFAK